MALRPQASSEASWPSVCVVGAGVAALTAARKLHECGFAVHLFGYCGHRKLAGRLYTETWDLKAHRMDGTRKIISGRETPENTLRFDTGCQWLSAGDPRFLRELERWQRSGAVAEWEGAVFGSMRPDKTFEPLAERPPVWCGVGGNARIVEHLAADLPEGSITHHIAQRFVQGSRDPSRYSLEYEETLTQNHLDFVGGNLPLDRAKRKTTEEFDYVVLAHGLGTNQPRMVGFEDPKAQEVPECLKRNVRWHTLHAVTLAFSEPLPLTFDVCRVPETTGQGLALVVHASGKPGMNTGGGPDVWTLFPSVDFAREYAKPKHSKECQRTLVERFFALFQLHAYRRRLLSDIRCPFGLIWPHGRCTTRPPGENTRALFSPEARVGVCADYAGGAPCVEAAVVSALELADAIRAHAEKRPLPDTVLTDLSLDWEPISVEVPWVIAHFPGLPVPTTCLAACPPVPISASCCPTHDPLGAHPGLVFGRTAKLKPWEREQAERGERVNGLDVSEFMQQRPRRTWRAGAAPADEQRGAGQPTAAAAPGSCPSDSGGSQPPPAPQRSSGPQRWKRRQHQQGETFDDPSEGRSCGKAPAGSQHASPSSKALGA